MTKREPTELWLGDRGRGDAGSFGSHDDSDERLHPDGAPAGDWLTETWAYMWYIPEANISSIIHVWVHPNLGVVTPNIAVWQGHKPYLIFAELLDGFAYRSAADLGDGSRLSFENSLIVETIEPFRKMRIRYDDPARGNSLDLQITAHSPPVMRGNRKHFDQVTRNVGVLSLRGRKYHVDCFGMRDRSWGQLRTEAKIESPPIGWLNGTFPELGMSWLVAATDDPARDPEWRGKFEVRADEAVHDAWIWRDGKLSRPRAVSKITRRTGDVYRPESHEIDIVDAEGRDYHIEGRVTASLPWNSWTNILPFICLTEWRLEGALGFGDTQETYWCDYPYRMRGTDADSNQKLTPK
jgi:hypothetical protein